MTGRETAYSVLGLRPGAPRAEVDEAYRRLIKRHHPDYTGGDGDRAAEINRAYSLIRKHTHQPVPQRPMVMAVPARPHRRRRRGGRVAALAAIAGIVLLARSASTGFEQPWPAFPLASAPAAAAEEAPAAAVSGAEGLAEPLATALIDRSINDALRLHETGDTALVASYSRACVEELRDKPSLARFDSCAAYDEAIAILQAGDPAHDNGPFNSAALTARQVSAAKLLFGDYLDADSRLQQIRTRVHMTLLPGIPDSIAAAEAMLVGGAAR